MAAWFRGRTESDAVKSLPPIAVIVALSLLAGCAGPFQTDYDIAHERVAAYIAQHPGLDAETRDAMQHFTLRVGMTPDQAIATWGRPTIVQSFRDGRQQYWHFGCDWPHQCMASGHGSSEYRTRALFEDGRVTAWWGG